MKPSIDELDIRLLDLLQADARKPYVKLAEELGISDTTVRTRIERLVRRFGVRFVVDLDPHDLGLLFLYLAVRVQGPTLAKAIERMSRLPEVVFLGRTTGGYDLIAELVCRDRDDLVRILDELRAIPGISHLDTFSVLGVEKEDWRFSGFAVGRASS
ncbi:MAG: Lrp/AsnC family transcriptional regulator [Actinomycetota bacterium]